MANDDELLGTRVRAARAYAGLSQRELATKLGMERRILVAIEAGNPRHPLSIREAQKIAQRCRVPTSFLLTGWAAPSELIERVDALETELGRAREDLELQAELIEALAGRLESRYAELASQALQRDDARNGVDSRPRQEGPSAP